MAPPAYLSYLLFGESVANLALQILAVAILGNLAFRCVFVGKRLRPGRRKITWTLFIYLFTQKLFLAAVIPSHVYTVFWWSPGTVLKKIEASHWKPDYQNQVAKLARI